MTATRATARTSVAAVLLLAGGLLAGCGGASGTGTASSHGAGSAGSITLYSGQHEQTTDSLVAGFEKVTGINVNVRYDDEDTLVDEIVTEGANSPADVIYTENTPALEYLQEKHLLSRSTPPSWPAPPAGSIRRRATGSASRPG